MPTKKIYVSANDEKVFRAVADTYHGGNVSQAVVAAMIEYQRRRRGGLKRDGNRHMMTRYQKKLLKLTNDLHATVLELANATAED